MTEPTIISQTQDYIIINKPAGLLVHPTTKGETDTVANWLTQKFPELIGVGEYDDRPGIVHRLDKHVSGLLVVARTQAMFEHLKKQFQERTIEKKYIALVYKQILADYGTIDFPIGRGKDGRMAARPNTKQVTLKNVGRIQTGREAVTDFEVIKRFPRYTLVDVTIHTGRTHQIRVHLFAYGHPIVGDPLYIQTKLIKKNDTPLERIFLHSHTLCFADMNDERQCFESPLPDDLQQKLDTLSH